MKLKADVAIPIVAMVAFLILGIVDVVEFDTAAFWFAFVGATIGWAFLIHFTLLSHPRWWKDEIGVDLFLWPAIVSLTLSIVVLNAFFGAEWISRDLFRFLVFAAAFLALWRREALYLRERASANHERRLDRENKKNG